VPRPSEGYRIYDRGSRRTPQDDNRPLGGDDVGPGERAYLRSVISAHLRHQGACRFINKNTRNARRLPFLDRMFPDALYLHLFRDPRPTVSSLLRVAFWPQLRLSWRGDRTTQALVAGGHHAEVLAAELWRHEVSRARQDAATLVSDRVLSVRYEDLVVQPRTAVAEVLAFAGLTWNADFDSVFSSFNFIPDKSSYQRLLTPAQIDRIDEVTGDLAGSLGYPPDR
jgi:omega-hydroxy-beta-dihydromenaquinone-9 sulfotransferase